MRFITLSTLALLADVLALVDALVLADVLALVEALVLADVLALVDALVLAEVLALVDALVLAEILALVDALVLALVDALVLADVLALVIMECPCRLKPSSIRIRVVIIQATNLSISCMTKNCANPCHARETAGTTPHRKVSSAT